MTVDQAAKGDARREEILAFVRTYLRSWGYPPSMQEIATGIGVEKNAVRYHLIKLQKQGKVAMTPGKYRSLRVLGDDDEKELSTTGA